MRGMAARAGALRGKQGDPWGSDPAAAAAVVVVGRRRKRSQRDKAKTKHG